jgi:endonuclease/exonuclease/phosphatase family metal-dependent hydrolase
VIKEFWMRRLPSWLSALTGTLGLVAGLVGIVVGTAAAGGVAAHETGAPTPVMLRVMSYNIHAGTGQDNVFDLERQATAIEAQRPDVIALQEVDVHWGNRSNYVDEASWLAWRLGMRVFFGPIYTLPPDRPDAPPREFGLAVLSRYPILTAKNHEITRLSTLVPDAVPELTPGFPEALINARGARVRVYSAHLDFRSDPSVRSAQVADMIAIMKREPGAKILAGDFNATPEAAELGPLWADLGLSDALTYAGAPDVPTYPADVPREQIDYVTVSADVGVRATWVPNTTASDHRPVVADVTLPRRS